MARSYYVIELSARWLTALLVALALVMVLAFAFGYGAAWSVLTGRQEAIPTPAVPAAAATATALPETQITTATPMAKPTRRPTSTAVQTPVATATAAVPAAPTVAEGEDQFWVQVLASSSPQAIQGAQERLEGLGFPEDHQRVSTASVAGGNVLYKLRVGPFPDRDSADRVVRRLQGSGYPDAWVVVP